MKVGFWKSFRLVLTIILFFTVVSYIVKFQNEVFLGDAFIYLLLVLISIVLLILNWRSDFREFRRSKKVFSILSFFISVLSILSVFICEIAENYKFNKKTSLKVFYDGDINGAGFDFKTDGTYIFESSAIGIVDYYYGNYQINGNNFVLDREKIELIIDSKFLSVVNDSILVQVDKNGEIIPSACEFRIINDNRLKSNNHPTQSSLH